MNWEPSMDPYELRESIGENLEETLPAGKGRLSLALA